MPAFVVDAGSGWSGFVRGFEVVMQKGDVEVVHNPSDRTQVVSKGGRVIERNFGVCPPKPLGDYLRYVDIITG